MRETGCDPCRSSTGSEGSAPVARLVRTSQSRGPVLWIAAPGPVVRPCSACALRQLAGVDVLRAAGPHVHIMVWARQQSIREGWVTRPISASPCSRHAATVGSARHGLSPLTNPAGRGAPAPVIPQRQLHVDPAADANAMGLPVRLTACRAGIVRAPGTDLRMMRIPVAMVWARTARPDLGRRQPPASNHFVDIIRRCEPPTSRAAVRAGRARSEARHALSKARRARPAGLDASVVSPGDILARARSTRGAIPPS